METRKFSAAILAVLMLSGSACADILLTYKRNFTIGGNSYNRHQITVVDDSSNSLYFDNSVISGNDRITGLHRVSDREILFTTRGDFSIGGASYDRGDIVRYNRVTGESSLVFDSSILSDTRVRALSQFDNGDLALTLNRNFSIGSTSYRRGDVVRYSLSTGTHSLYFDVDDITADARHIEALHVISDTKLILSHSRGFTLGGIRFRRGDLVKYDTATGIASLYRSRDTLADETRLTAFSVETVPEPGSLAVITVLTGVAILRRRRKRANAIKLDTMKQN